METVWDTRGNELNYIVESKKKHKYFDDILKQGGVENIQYMQIVAQTYMVQKVTAT